MTVMTSYNKINGIYASSRYDLCTHILRGEWGFKGYVMTDWGSQSNKAQDMHAGNDMIMDGNPINIMTNAVLAPKPVFNTDGRVEFEKISMHGGYYTKEAENWGSFKLDAMGKDRCTTTVSAEQEVNEKVVELVKGKEANITLREDGSKIIEYYGVELGAFITLGDLQNSAINFLNVVLKSWNMQSVYNDETGYESIDIKPYSSGIEQLEKYFIIQ